MNVDIKKLKLFLTGAVKMEPMFLSDSLDEDEAKEIQEELKDEAGETAQTARLLSSCYTELAEGVLFRCGDCKFLSDESVCLNACVRASVNENGCCNFFEAKNPDSVVFPPQDRPSILKEDEVDPEQLEKGIEEEMEHTDDSETAKKIALDHLSETPDYYTRLSEAMED
jgi:hypothetical protein